MQVRVGIIWARVRSSIQAQDWKVVCVLGIPLAICVVLLVSIGPQVQQHVFSALNGDAPSIYQSAYQQQIPVFPTLIGWLGQAVDWPYLLIGLVGATVALKSQDMKSSAIAVALSSAIIFSLIDIVAVLLSKEPSLAAILTNLVGNLLGGILMGFLVAAGLIGYRYMSSWVGGSGIAALVPASAVLILWGLLISAVAFYAIAFVYKPLPSEIDLVAEPSIKGSLSYAPNTQWVWDQSPRKGERKDTGGFSFLPDQDGPGELDVIGSEKSRRITWARAEAAPRHRVQIWFFEDCPFWKPEALPLGRPVFNEDDVRNIVVTIEDATANLKYKPGGGAKFNYRPNLVTLFWVDKSEEKDKYKVTFFSSPKDDLSASSTGESIFLLDVFLFTHEKRTKDVVPYPVTISTNGKVRTLLLSKTLAYRPNEKFRCRPVSPGVRGQLQGQPISGTPLSLGEGAADFSILVKIIPMPGVSEPILRDSNRIELKGFNGWATVSGLTQDGLMRSPAGKVDMLEIERGLATLKVDGSAVESKPDDHLMLFGDFRAEYLSGGEASH